MDAKPHLLQQLSGTFARSFASHAEIQRERLPENFSNGLAGVQAFIRILEDELDLAQLLRLSRFDRRWQGTAGGAGYDSG
jgi:hypothetical protein